MLVVLWETRLIQGDPRTWRAPVPAVSFGPHGALTVRAETEQGDLVDGNRYRRVQQHVTDPQIRDGGQRRDAGVEHPQPVGAVGHVV